MLNLNSIEHEISIAHKNYKRIFLLSNLHLLYEPRHEMSSNVVSATSKASDQPAHLRSLIRAFASRLHILGVFSY